MWLATSLFKGSQPLPLAQKPPRCRPHGDVAGVVQESGHGRRGGQLCDPHREETPLKRVAHAAEIANAILYLASEKFLSGVVTEARGPHGAVLNSKG
jgi:NAD(P)-dependent dehydrogenase (short-subunit alcohol dehydrogenase family)